MFRLSKQAFFKYNPHSTKTALAAQIQYLNLYSLIPTPSWQGSQWPVPLIDSLIDTMTYFVRRNHFY